MTNQNQLVLNFQDFIHADGDLWKTARDYNGSGPKAERYADDLVRRVEEEKNMADPMLARVPDVPSKQDKAGGWSVMRGEAVIRLVDESGRDRGGASVPMSAWNNRGRAVPAGGR